MNDFQNIGKLLDSELFYRHATLCFVLGKERDLTPQRRKVCAIFVSMYVCMVVVALECSVTYIPFIIFNHSSHNLYIHTYIHSYIHSSYIIYTFIHTYIHTYIDTYVHTFIHTYIHTYIDSFIHSYIHTYIHTYIYTIHTYIHCS